MKQYSSMSKEELIRRIEELEKAATTTPEDSGNGDIRKSLQIHKWVIDHSTDAIGMSTPEGKHYYQNQAFDDVFGNVGETPPDTLYVDPELGREVFATIMSGGNWTGEIELYDKNKDVITMLVTAYAVKDPEGKVINLVGMHTDISDRKRAERALRDSEQNLRITLQSIGDAVIATDTDGKVTRMNPVAERLTGWPANDALGQPLSRIFTIVDPSTRQPLDSRLTEVLREGQIVNFTNHPLLLARDGREYRVADSAAPIRYDSGELAGVVLVFRDITEENALLTQLHQAQKLKAVGQLAGGVAHDFNNMLGGILGAASFLTMKCTDDEQKKYLDMIVKCVEQAAELTSQLLAFARKQEPASSAINILDPLKDAIALLERTVDRRITLEASLPDAPLAVIGSPSQLQNAFLNLLINASHAMPDGGMIYVAAQAVDLDARYCEASSFDLEPGPHVDVEIRDTGHGIPAEQLPCIFDPFFTTKEPGEGTGLGLAAVHGTIEQHKGAITVYSETGKGTSFHLLFPAAPDDAPQHTPESRALVPGSGTVLLIDDEPVMRATAGGILEELGYTVILAENGRKGLELFAEDPDRIDVVILDMVMPEMNGRDCFEAIRKIKPDVRVILSSGFSREGELEALQSSSLKGFIHKPYRAAVLSQAVSDAMQDAP